MRTFWHRTKKVSNKKSDLRQSTMIEMDHSRRMDRMVWLWIAQKCRMLKDYAIDQ